MNNHHDDAGDHAFVDPLRQYLGVFVTLLVLLCLTYGVYFIPFENVHIGGIDLGFMNTVIALLIACTKALLVLVVFMHLNHSTKLTWIIGAAGFVWLAIMVVFTFTDYLSRDAIPGAIRPASVVSRTVPLEH